MSTETAGIPRYRPYGGPPLFRQGFRPFFLGAGVWAFLALILWLAMLDGAPFVPTLLDPVAWHAHEMIFGFAAAVIAGFLLTAIPNWTGRMPLQGAPLIGLFAAWLAGRIAMATSDVIGPGTAAVLDLAFLVILLAVVVREILAGRNWRNLPMPLALGLLIAANALTHLERLDLAATGAAGQRLGIATIVMLIGLIGGRVVPSFTRNWLVKRGVSRLPASFNAFDRACLSFTIVALVLWVIGLDGPIAGGAIVIAGLAHAARLARWQGHLTLAEPLVWSLHAGYVWVPIGLCLLGLSLAAPDLVPASAALHALTVGAIGAMTLAVMTRATLGHTGQALHADTWTAAIYLSILLAATLRLIGALGIVSAPSVLAAAGVFWALAFGIFVLRYGRLLIR